MQGLPVGQSVVEVCPWIVGIGKLSEARWHLCFQIELTRAKTPNQQIVVSIVSVPGEDFQPPRSGAPGEKANDQRANCTQDHPRYRPGGTIGCSHFVLT